ncbi:sensor histidine kinase [Altererythrobacter buctensis]|uniref:histidine kinase n=2 Tax=Alteraurantiacibacter buctensis TaxID=1503981 RepID=A0A844YZE1_9SPHN|nr:sensor histidine kinase [Alteraurantiacibacter buctensis]
MMFDDRLATVLGSPVGGETAARTQFRQLVDLLGTPGRNTDSPLEARAWARLAELGELIPAEERSRILRDPGLRLRDPRLIGVLAAGDAKPAAAAMAVARLDEAQWRTLIPTLPVMARGFLRHRRDLPQGTRELLRHLGAGDMLLPQPEGATAPSPLAPAPPPPGTVPERDSIRALLRRIEAFREGRRPDAAAGPLDPRLPLGDVAEDEAAPAPPAQFAFTADETGRIGWTDDAVAPLLCGLRLGPAGPGSVAALEDRAVRAMQGRQPLHGAALAIDAAPAITGDWRVDAEPVFAPGGAFTGWRGRLRRPVFLPAPEAPPAPTDTPQDRMRQVLHELRTPVNAIQGFAEIIQQQLFGPAPNEYRAHAAAIAVDAAKLLAGFDEIDRLSKLEAGALELDQGEADLREVVELTVRRMEGVLRSRGAGFAVQGAEERLPTTLDRPELMVLVWRVLASLAGALAPSEVLGAELSIDDSQASLAVDLPGSIARAADPFALPLAEQRPVLSAGMFGPGFTFRLARAEAEAAGGTLAFADDTVTLRLPLLTGC